MFKAHSTGIVNATPVMPASADFLTEYDEKTNGQGLEYYIDVNDTDLVVPATHYYNGYQYNPEKQRYESEGGVHIDHPTDEATIMFDFSALDQSQAVRGTPELFLKREHHGDPELLPATYQDGILKSGPIKNPPVGAYIYCHWEWHTEPRSGT